MTELIELAKTLWQRKKISIEDLLASPASNEFKQVQQVLSSTNARQILFHVINQHNTVPCCNCGTSLSWHPDRREYRRYCSAKCTAKYTVDQKKIKNLTKFGTEWHTQTANWHQKVINSSLEKFGVEHYSQTPEFKERVKSTLKTKHGVEHPMHLASTKDKIKQSCLKKYGVSNPAQCESVQARISQTCLEKYGATSPLKNNHIQSKIKKTLLEKYGVDHPQKSLDISSKTAATRKQNYYRPEVLALLNNPDWLAKQNQNGRTVGEIAAELGVSASNLCKYYNKYQIEIVYHSTSALEKKLYDYYADSGVVAQIKNKTMIAPKELDLYFAEARLAVEVNGAYYHCEKHGKGQYYHLNKSIGCSEKNIDLYHFWDWEINEKFDIVTSMLNTRLGLSTKFFARQTTIKPVNTADKTAFLNKNHIQSAAASSINIGLFDCNNNLIMLACFGHSRYSKKYNFELIRLCSQLNTIVIGGASKLLKFFVDNYMGVGQKLVSYCDRRYSRGNVYHALGFSFSHATKPGYCYVTKSGIFAGNRQQWQKHLLKSKLEIFDEFLTEAENMQANGYEKLWDCGQLVFEFEKTVSK